MFVFHQILMKLGEVVVTMTTTTSPIFIKIRWKTKKCERMCIHHYSERKPLLIHFLDFCLQISQQLEVEYHRCTQGWWRSLCLPNIIISTKDFGDISQCQRLKISDFSYFFKYLLINIKSIFFCLFSHFCTISLDLGVLQLLDDQNNDIILRSRYVVELECSCLCNDFSF